MFCQPEGAPAMTGSVGKVRSRRTVLPASATAGAQPDVLPTASADRNCTIVSPSAMTATLGPDAGADQLVPPSVDVRYS
jgi:hypothetical protein